MQVKQLGASGHDAGIEQCPPQSNLQSVQQEHVHVTTGEDTFVAASVRKCPAIAEGLAFRAPTDSNEQNTSASTRRLLPDTVVSLLLKAIRVRSAFCCH